MIPDLWSSRGESTGTVVTTVIIISSENVWLFCFCSRNHIVFRKPPWTLISVLECFQKWVLLSVSLLNIANNLKMVKATHLKFITHVPCPIRTLITSPYRAFPVAAARLWNSLPSHVTAAPSLSIFCCHLKSHLFSISYPTFWLFSHLYSVRIVTRYFGHLICICCNAAKFGRLELLFLVVKWKSTFSCRQRWAT